MKKDEQGAAMMISLAVFLFLYLMVSSIFAIGNTVHEKIQLQNACDAAAYAAAVVEADGLSRMATVNRALAWAYVQNVRHHMDYIVYQWLKLSCQKFAEDLSNCQAFNAASPSLSVGIIGVLPLDVRPVPYFSDQNYHSYIQLACGTHHTEGNQGAYWAGWTENENNNHLMRLGYATQKEKSSIEQPGRFWSKDTIQQSFVDNQQLSQFLTTSLLQNDADVIAALNGTLMNLANGLNDAMQKAAMEAFRMSLPPSYENDDYSLAISMPFFTDPYFSVQESSDADSSSGQTNIKPVLSSVRNNEEDELEFLAGAFATTDLYDIFGDGIDQWFIRQYNSDSPYVGKGLQRLYKSSNQDETGLFAVKRGNHVAYGGKAVGTIKQIAGLVGSAISLGNGVIKDVFLATLYAKGLAPAVQIAQRAPANDNIPSCGHFKTRNSQQCKSPSIKDCFGLVTEYHWASMQWWCMQDWQWVCIPVYIPFSMHELWFTAYSGDLHYKVGALQNCPHGLGSTGSNTRNSYKSCFMGSDNLSLNLHGSSNFIPGYVSMGYTRIYGDDAAIYNSATYSTALAKPVKLNRNFFRERIQVVGGKRQSNPLRWMFSGNAPVISSKSPFSMFNPQHTSSDQSYDWLLATSAATAVCREKNATYYDPKFNQLTSYEDYDADTLDNTQETLYNPVRPRLVVYDASELGTANQNKAPTIFDKLRIGCPHVDSSNNYEQRLARAWNLSETDWNAAFTPVAFSGNAYESSYDESYNNTDSHGCNVPYRYLTDRWGMTILDEFQNLTFKRWTFKDGAWSANGTISYGMSDSVTLGIANGNLIHYGAMSSPQPEGSPCVYSLDRLSNFKLN